MKFQSLEEFVHSDEFSRKDLSECDLSNLDLSVFPPSTWKEFIFYKTNFTDTNIKFYPQMLKKDSSSWILCYCNFTNCDLSYLTAEDLEKVSINGSDFTNTNFHVDYLDCDLNFYGVTFGDAYHGRELDKYAFKMDIDTLLQNPNLSFSSNSILQMLHNSYPHCITAKIDKILEIDKNDSVKSFMENDHTKRKRY